MITPRAAANLVAPFLGRVGLILAVSVISAVTVVGKESASAKAVVVYGPRPELPDVVLRKRLAGSGIFLSHVRPDGSVSRVDVLRSTGHRELDAAVVSAFKKWRFKPGTVKEVRTPVTFTGNYTAAMNLYSALQNRAEGAVILAASACSDSRHSSS